MIFLSKILVNRNKVRNKGYKEFQANSNIHFHLLQFVEDAILVDDGSWDNLYTIKYIFRLFELVSGLRVNFFKSKLYIISLDHKF